MDNTGMFQIIFPFSVVTVNLVIPGHELENNTERTCLYALKEIRIKN